MLYNKVLETTITTNTICLEKASMIHRSRLGQALKLITI